MTPNNPSVLDLEAKNHSLQNAETAKAHFEAYTACMERLSLALWEIPDSAHLQIPNVLRYEMFKNTRSMFTDNTAGDLGPYRLGVNNGYIPLVEDFIAFLESELGNNFLEELVRNTEAHFEAREEAQSSTSNQRFTLDSILKKSANFPSKKADRDPKVYEMLKKLHSFIQDQGIVLTPNTQLVNSSQYPNLAKRLHERHPEVIQLITKGTTNKTPKYPYLDPQSINNLLAHDLLLAAVVHGMDKKRESYAGKANEKQTQAHEAFLRKAENALIAASVSSSVDHALDTENPFEQEQAFISRVRTFQSMNRRNDTHKLHPEDNEEFDTGFERPGSIRENLFIDSDYVSVYESSSNHVNLVMSYYGSTSQCAAKIFKGSIFGPLTLHHCLSTTPEGEELESCQQMGWNIFTSFFRDALQSQSPEQMDESVKNMAKLHMLAPEKFTFSNLEAMQAAFYEDVKKYYEFKKALHVIQFRKQAVAYKPLSYFLGEGRNEPESYHAEKRKVEWPTVDLNNRSVDAEKMGEEILKSFLAEYFQESENHKDCEVVDSGIYFDTSHSNKSDCFILFPNRAYPSKGSILAFDFTEQSERAALQAEKAALDFYTTDELIPGMSVGVCRAVVHIPKEVMNTIRNLLEQKLNNGETFTYSTLIHEAFEEVGGKRAFFEEFIYPHVEEFETRYAKNHEHYLPQLHGRKAPKKEPKREEKNTTASTPQEAPEYKPTYELAKGIAAIRKIRFHSNPKQNAYLLLKKLGIQKEATHIDALKTQLLQVDSRRVRQYSRPQNEIIENFRTLSIHPLCFEKYGHDGGESYFQEFLQALKNPPTLMGLIQNSKEFFAQLGDCDETTDDRTYQSKIVEIFKKEYSEYRKLKIKLQKNAFLSNVYVPDAEEFKDIAATVRTSASSLTQRDIDAKPLSEGITQIPNFYSNNGEIKKKRFTEREVVMQFFAKLLMKKANISNIYVDSLLLDAGSGADLFARMKPTTGKRHPVIALRFTDNKEQHGATPLRNPSEYNLEKWTGRPIGEFLPKVLQFHLSTGSVYKIFDAIDQSIQGGSKDIFKSVFNLLKTYEGDETLSSIQQLYEYLGVG